MTSPDRTGSEDLQSRIRSVLAGHPVSVAYLFGSRASGDAGPQSDIDVAVSFEGLEPGDGRYTETLLSLSVDLATALGTDDVDVVDLDTAPPSLVRAVLDRGIRLIGSDDPETLVERARGAEGASARERFDTFLAATDEHLA